MFSDESSPDFIAFKNECQTKGAVPKITSSNTTSKLFESKESTFLSESCSTSLETIKSHNFRLSRSKFATLIDESDIKWWTDIQTNRLQAGRDEQTKSSASDLLEIKPKGISVINQLSNAPVNCPITDCKINFLPNDIILHFLSYHMQPAAIHRIFEQQRLFITLMPFELNVDEVSCVSLISYAGGKMQSDAVRASNLWIKQNLQLSTEFSHFSNDYSVFLLASIVPMDVFVRSKAQFDSNNICSSMFVLWLAGAQSNTKILCTITAFNDQLTNSHSGIYGVRALNEVQCPYEFCNMDCNYFRLTFKELYSLLRDEKTLKIELVFQDFLNNVGK